jgi:hypothetical protein
LFFRIEKNHPGIVFFARDYASRDQIYHFIHLTLRLFSTPTVADVRLLGVHSEPIRKQQTFVRNVIIEGAPHENKMAGKGQITSERARNGNGTWTS